MGKGNRPPFPQFLAGHPPFFHPAAKSTPSEVSWPPSQHSLQSPCSLTCDNVNMLFHFVKSPSSWVSQFHKLLLLTLIFLQPHKMQLSSKFISFSLFMLVTYDRNPIQTSSSKKENVLVPKIEQFVKRHVFRYSWIQGSKLHLSLSLSALLLFRWLPSWADSTALLIIRPPAVLWPSSLVALVEGKESSNGFNKSARISFCQNQFGPMPFPNQSL